MLAPDHKVDKICQNNGRTQRCSWYLASKKMRVVYSDESGTGGKNEPITVVTAIMFNMDSQWPGVLQDIETALAKIMPAGRAAHYEIKGTRLYREIRKGSTESWNLLGQLLTIPQRHGLLIFYVAIDRQGYAALLNRLGPSKNLTGDIYNAAFFACAGELDTCVHMVYPKERVLWISDKSNTEDLLKAGLGDFRVISQMDLNSIWPNWPSVTKPHVSHIVDTVYFGHSGESRGLQLADICCSTITRAFHREKAALEALRLIQPRIWLPKPPLFSEQLNPKSIAAFKEMWGLKHD
jgi:hypothetical protein